MSDYFFQIFLALVGIVIGLVAIVLKKRKWIKVLSGIFGFLLVVTAIIWVVFTIRGIGIDTDYLLTVRVADQNGHSIPNAKTLIFFSEGSLQKISDSDGISNFTISAPTPKEIRLIVEVDGYSIYEKQIQTARENQLDIRLIEQEGNKANIILRTIDDVSTSPLPSIEINIVAQGEIYKQTTDSDGFAIFDINFPPDGVVSAEISVNEPGYENLNQNSSLVSSKLQYIKLTSSSLQVEIPVIPTATASFVTAISGNVESDSVEIGSGVTISFEENDFGLRVVILDPNGNPWENVYVRVDEQLADASGNPSRGGRVKDGRINLQGIVDFELGDGNYVVCPDKQPGYGWTTNDCIYDIQVQSGKKTVVRMQVGLLEIGLIGATEQSWENVYYQIYSQKLDATGFPTTDRRVADGRTDNGGIGSAWLTPGMYAVVIDFLGYDWGDLKTGEGKLNIPIKSGETHYLEINMGRLEIGLNKPDGTPNNNAYIEFYTQVEDVNGNQSLGDRIWSGRTDNAGYSIIPNLTEGFYALKVGESILYSLPIEWGKTTQTDGKTFSFQ